MYVEIFAICDAATDYNGRLNLLGAFEGIMAPSAPVARERCSVVARIRFTAAEAGRHLVEVGFVSDKGVAAGPKMSANIAVKAVAGRSSGAHNLVLNINRLQFPEFGAYEIQLRVDGEVARILPLIVAQAPKRTRLRNPMEN